MNNQSVVQDWVSTLSLREQGVLLSAIRGCDDAPKRPYDSAERRLVSYLRYLILNPADPRELMYHGAFMQISPPDPNKWSQSDLGHYPLHWVSHIMHAFEIIGYRHPDVLHSERGYSIYEKLVHGLHLNVETCDQMIIRLTADRVASGNVVS